MVATDVDHVRKRVDAGSLDEAQLSDMQGMLQEKDSLISQLQAQLKAVTDEISSVIMAYQVWK